jgi:hypothetical protein
MILIGKTIFGNAVNKTNENNYSKVQYMILFLLVAMVLIIIAGVIVKNKKKNSKKIFWI